jgi:membrane protease YdiL (CAAX protease family)
MMKKNKISLIIWLIAGALGLSFFIGFFNHAFPIASIDLRLTKDQALERASAFIQGQGYDLSGFDRTVLFDSDYEASVYLQKEKGIKKSNQLIKEGIPVWFWRVRWFKELEKEGFYCNVDPATGQIISFYHALLDDAPGDNLTAERARSIAEQNLADMGIDLNLYELKENNSEVQKNRTDHYFAWQKKDFSISDAYLRVSASVYGSELGQYRRYLDIPEGFLRNLQKDFSLGQVLSMITMICMFVLFIAAIVVLVIQFKKDNLDWKFGLGFGILVVLLSVGDFFNGIALLWNAYPDTMSKANFISIAAGGAVIGALLIGLLIFIFGSSGKSLAKEVSGFDMPVFEALKTKKADNARILPVFVVGYSLAFCFLGYITLFYLVGTRFFNIWMPPEAEYSNILGTAMPFLFPLTVAVSASVSEEFIFRLFSISLLKKYTKLTWLAVLVPAMIWAFAHSNYPVFPAYVRGIELTIAGIIFGIVFLKYGLETVLITHFVIDAALVALPLLKSHNSYYFISGAVVVTIALLPLLMIYFPFGRKTQVNPDNKN